jgi:hypothetical protein
MVPLKKTTLLPQPKTISVGRGGAFGKDMERRNGNNRLPNGGNALSGFGKLFLHHEFSANVQIIPFDASKDFDT